MTADAVVWPDVCVDFAELSFKIAREVLTSGP